MLPFLKKQQEGAASLPVESEIRDEDSDGIQACMSEFISAVQANDAKGAAQAFKDAFEILESKPHEEAPHKEGE